MVNGWARKPHENSPAGGLTHGGDARGNNAAYDNDVHRNNALLTTPDDPVRPRSSSDSATPRGTPVPVPQPRLGFLSSAPPGTDTPSRSLFSGSEPSTSAPTRKRGLLTDKLQSLAGHHHGSGHTLIPKSSSLNPALLLHPHIHSRTSDSAISPTSPTFPPSPTMSSANKVHTSPSKASYGRTYDSKLVTREMHRLGNLAHLPSGLTPALSQAPSVSSLSLPATGAMTQANMASTSSSDPWGTLHVHILPLFNGEPLRIPIGPQCSC
ncbi:hypothetical protein CPB85DRAFT_634988 [Mucidula mucida]|nr:hypothetical protein CPB85DRAFT_634988 [Mucidula mucida]